MSNTMPSPDAALKDFFSSNMVFAGLFNGFLFGNKNIVNPDDLKNDDASYTVTVSSKTISGRNLKRNIRKISRYRDVVRKTSIGYLVVLGIENQDRIHYSMPVRKQLYDALTYTSELSMLGEIQDQSDWTVDERLSEMKRFTKVTPIITVVFYTGEKAWDGPRSLHEMMDIDEKVKKFVPDYPLYVIDIGHDKDLSFKNKELEELRVMLSSIYSNSGDNNETTIANSIIALAGILAGDEKLYYSAANKIGGETKMCQALQERDERIKAEFALKFAEQEAEIARLKKLLEVNHISITSDNQE